MRVPRRPHTLGIDDGPFEKRAATPVPIIGVMMEGRDLVEAAGLLDRLPIVERTPAAQRVDTHLYLASAGISPAQAVTLLSATRLKSDLPEPLRLAHLIAAAVASGESRGRV